MIASTRRGADPPVRPPYLHTNSTRVFDYLSRFTRWRPYEHQVVANLPDGDGRLEYPVPFNLVSLRAAFPPEKARALAEKLVSAYGMEKKVTILELRQNPDPELSALADYVYGHVFVRYTMKQWGQTPEEIDPNTTARVPSFCRRTAATFRTPTRACLWRATPHVPVPAGPPGHHGGAGGGRGQPPDPGRRAALLDGSPSPARSSTPARRTSCSAANTAACPTAPWTFRFETHPVDFWQSTER